MSSFLSTSTTIFSVVCLLIRLSASTNSKQGVCSSTKSLCTDLSVLTSPTWQYSWTRWDKFGSKKLDCSDPSSSMEFVPMIAKYYPAVTYTTASIESGATYVLGYNEPNIASQANLLPAEAYEGWQKIQALWGDTHILVSPSASTCTYSTGACVDDERYADVNDWFDEFFSLCGGSWNGTCDISYLATHAYLGTADAVMDYLEGLYDSYGLKIWLTEFACEWGSRKTAAENQAFMTELLPRLDASEFVFRYAWFASRNALPKTLMTYTDTTVSHLTTLGDIYNDHIDISAAAAAVKSKNNKMIIGEDGDGDGIIHGTKFGVDVEAGAGAEEVVSVWTIFGCILALAVLAMVAKVYWLTSQPQAYAQK